MGSYTFYVAAMAIACAILLQDVSGESCDTIKVWDNTFKEEKSLEFMKYLFETIEVLSTDEVCSDTYRALIEFIKEQVTDENALYFNKKLNKLISSLLTEMTKDKKNYDLMTLLHFSNETAVRQLVLNVIRRSTDMLQDQNKRKRLAKMVEVIIKIITPSASEVNVKEKLNSLKAQPSNFIKKSLSKASSLIV